VLTTEDSFLGRGAYGEVRKAVWRGIPVAAKRLHLLKGGNCTSSWGKTQSGVVPVQAMVAPTPFRHPASPCWPLQGVPSPPPTRPPSQRLGW
jgi:hypothetical protein